jgi:uncharacterized protein (TIGR02597 family)
MNKKLSLLSLGFLMAGTLSAAEVVSAPVGFLKVTFPGSSTNSFSIPLQRNATAVGPISSVTSNALTDTKAVWTSGQFATSSNPHFVKMLTGASAGRYFLITSNTVNKVVVDTRGANLTTLVAAGNRYQIGAGRTLGATFGTTTVPFRSGTNYLAADNLKLWSGSGWEIYYHNGTNWMRNGKSTVQNDVVIYPDEGIQVVRRATTSLTIAIAGEASLIAEKTQTVGPATTYAANRFPVNVTLGNLGLLALPNWIKAASSSTADRVQLCEGGKWITYWHNGTNWIKSGTTASQNAAPLPAGTSYLILRKSSSVGVSDVASQPVPY